MDKFIHAIYSCFENSTIISLQNLDTIKECSNQPNYKVKSNVVISLENLDMYNEILVEPENNDLYYVFD